MNKSIPIKIFIHVEEPSMKEVIDILIPKIVGESVEFNSIDHGSKSRLLADLPARLKGYKKRVFEDIRVVILVDRDNDECSTLKTVLEEICAKAECFTKTNPSSDGNFQVVSRIVIEELEAWFFGDIAALTAAYPKLPRSLHKRAGFRDPDNIKGGTWEALLRVLKQHDYYKGVERLPKIDVARRISKHMSLDLNISKSFTAFVAGVRSVAPIPNSKTNFTLEQPVSNNL